MNVGERIKKLRKELLLTQQEFGEKIGLKRNSLALIETGRNPSNPAIISICREFNVNETWLRTGEGEMFRNLGREDEISSMIHKLLSGENAEFKRRLISVLSSLKEEHWGIIEGKINELVAAPSEPPPAAFTAEELAVYEKVKAAKEEEHRQIVEKNLPEIGEESAG